MTPEHRLKWLLRPLSFPYGAATSLRTFLYRRGILRQRHLDGIVISVGNLTAGGTGKTPMVLWIAERLLAEGSPCGILTRGYRGDVHSDGRTSDEVRLLQSRLGGRVAFGVGADRFAHGRELARRGVRWFILDDGFQHWQLARDVDIVLLDATNPFGGGRLLPAGRLREPRPALARANIIVITRSDSAPAVEATVRQYSRAPIFYSRTHLDSIRLIVDGHLDTEIAPSQLPKLFAFCAIGNPAAFLADLRAWGLQVARHRCFRDHHRYTSEDFEAILRDARAAGCSALICTEKDLQNLPVTGRDLPVYCCTISLQIERGDELWRAIMACGRSNQKIQNSTSLHG